MQITPAPPAPATVGAVAPGAPQTVTPVGPVQAVAPITRNASPPPAKAETDAKARMPGDRRASVRSGKRGPSNPPEGEEREGEKVNLSV